MPELRKDPVLGTWVIIATERGVRPSDYTLPHDPIPARACPFCPGNESATPPALHTAIDESGQWCVRVVPNKYPALRIEGQLEKRGQHLYDMMNGIGAHEVVIDSPQHDRRWSQADQSQICTVLEAFRTRIKDLTGDRRFEYVVVFKNDGKPAGATLAHPHSQIIALPLVPQLVHAEQDGAKRYHAFRDRCAYCDMIELEQGDGDRLVWEDERAIAFTPFASRFPFEVAIFPKAHHATFEHTPVDTMMSVAEAMRQVMSRVDRALGNAPYNFTLHNSPLRQQDTAFYHWHIRVTPRLTHVAGFEWGTGFFINPTPPEEAAAFLRTLS